MTEQDLDKLWNQALRDSVVHNEPFTRYRYAKLVIEQCALAVDAIEARCVAKDVDDPPLSHVAQALRQMSPDIRVCP
jgi:hypothetical protein